jgi:hypothetical protein
MERRWGVSDVARGTLLWLVMAIQARSVVAEIVSVCTSSASILFRAPAVAVAPLSLQPLLVLLQLRLLPQRQHPPFLFGATWMLRRFSQRSHIGQCYLWQCQRDDC